MDNSALHTYVPNAYRNLFRTRYLHMSSKHPLVSIGEGGYRPLYFVNECTLEVHTTPLHVHFFPAFYIYSGREKDS